MPESPSNGTESPLEGPGSVIGPYKLLQQIGEGGFGTVFMAEQEHPIRRRVALKILKPGMDTRQVIARFEAERQALALMDHPNIARVLDAGSTAAGRPYFAMELVKGIPIQQYCDTQRLSTRERLELFVDVCRAVQHAHQKGIIHRDLKPSNILVGLHDGKAVPKVIDFGIAKALERKLTDKTLFTEFRQMIGTPAYMSPEQTEISGLDVDTRSDIYSLGVLLYELLTGALPFDLERLQQAGYGEILRIIREEEPAKPSTKVSTLAGSSSAAAARRRTEPGKLGALLRGELDWIVMKTLEKERARRYETADALAADVQRYLDDEPVLAGAPSRVYCARKFVRRHRVGVLTTAALVLLLGIGLAGTSVGLVRASHASARARQHMRDAQRQLNLARKGADILLNAVTIYVPMVAGTRDMHLQLLQAVQRHNERLDRERPSGAEAANWIQATYCSLSRAYLDQGDYPHARETCERFRSLVALELAQAPESVSTKRDSALSLDLQGSITFGEGDLDGAREKDQQALESLGDESSWGSDAPAIRSLIAWLHRKLGRTQMALSDFRAAREEFMRARDGYVHMGRPEDLQWSRQVELGEVHLGLAMVDLNEGQGAAGVESHLGDAQAIADRLGLDMPNATNVVLLAAHIELLRGGSLYQRNLLDGARECFAEAVRLGERMAADEPRHPYVLFVLNQAYSETAKCAVAMHDPVLAQGACELSLQATAQQLDLSPRLPAFLGMRIESLLAAEQVLAAQKKEGHPQKRAILLEESLGRLKTLECIRPNELAGLLLSCSVYSRVGQLDIELRNFNEAEQHFLHLRECAERAVKAAPSHAGVRLDVASSLQRLGWLMLSIGRIKEANEYYGLALTIGQELRKADPSNTNSTWSVANSLLGLGQCAFARSELLGAREALEASEVLWRELMRAPQAPLAWSSNLADALMVISDVDRGQGKPEKALDHLADARVLFEEQASDGRCARRLINNELMAGDIHAELAHPEEARKAFQRALARARALDDALRSDSWSQGRMAAAYEKLSHLSNADEARSLMLKAREIQLRRAADASADSAALNECAMLLLTCEPADLRDIKAAVGCAERAEAQTKSQSPEVLDTLAQAYFADGQAQRAADTEKEALALFDPRPSSRRTRFEERLAEYVAAAANEEGK